MDVPEAREDGGKASEVFICQMEMGEAKSEKLRTEMDGRTDGGQTDELDKR